MNSINYFDFLKIYPEIISIQISVDSLDYINFIENIHSEKNKKSPLIKVDIKKLSEIIHDEIKNKKETIFKKDINICIDDNIIITISRTQKKLLYPSNTKEERECEFYIYEFLCENFYFPENNELKNIKRTLLIDKCIN